MSESRAQAADLLRRMLENASRGIASHQTTVEKLLDLLIDATIEEGERRSLEALEEIAQEQVDGGARGWARIRSDRRSSVSGTDEPGDGESYRIGVTLGRVRTCGYAGCNDDAQPNQLFCSNECCDLTMGDKG